MYSAIYCIEKIKKSSGVGDQFAVSSVLRIRLSGEIEATEVMERPIAGIPSPWKEHSPNGGLKA